MTLPQMILIGVIAGFVIALIPLFMLISDLTTIHNVNVADSYRKEGSLYFNIKHDVFTHKNITRTLIEQNPPQNGGAPGSPGGHSATHH